MTRRSIVFLLLLSLVAPLNSGAAAWMSLSMSEQGEANQASSDDHRHADRPMHGDEHAHGQHADCHLRNPQPHGSAPAHDGHEAAHSSEMHGDGNAHDHHGTAQLRNTHIDGHSEEDCESECLSCTNHCSSLAILSQPNESENGSMALASSPSRCLSSLAEKLLRPPILV